MTRLVMLACAIALVAVGCTGSAIAPIRWERQPANTAFEGATVNGAAFRDGMWVAVGNVSGTQTDAAIWTSTDAVTWSRLALDNSFTRLTLSSVTAFGGGFAATATICGATEGCGGGGEVYATSANGTTWVRQPPPVELACCVMQSITAGGPGLVAVGLDYSAGFPAVPADAAVALSSDGVTWTHVLDLPSLGKATMGQVIAGGPGFVAAGYGEGMPQIWISPNGAQWERVSSADTTGGGQIGGLAQGGSRIVAAGSGAQGSAGVWTSDAAARSWASGMPPDQGAQSAATLKAITFSGSLFVAGGSDATGEPQVWTSPDATSWTRTIVGESAAPGASVNVIVGDGAERLIAFGVGSAGEVIIWAGRISTAAK